MSIPAAKLVKALKKSFPVSSSKGKKRNKHEVILEETIDALDHLLNNNQKEAQKIIKRAYKKLAKPIPKNETVSVSIVSLTNFISENESSLSHISVEVARLAQDHLI